MFMLISILGSIVAPALANRFGKKAVAIWGSATIFVTSVIMYFGGYPNMVMLVSMSAIGGFAGGAAGIAKMSMLADTVEYGEWKSGRRSEGMIFSVNILKTKIASAIGGGMGAIVLGLVGFVPKEVPSAATMNGIHMLFTLVPGILGLLTLIPLFYYDLSEERFSEIVNDIDMRSAVPAGDAE